MTGGTEIQTLNTVSALVQGGNEVTVACYFEHTPYMVERYQKAGAKVVLFSPEGTRIGGYRALLFLYKNLRQVVKEVHPDVTHVQYMAPGATIILLLWLMGVRNIIATSHTPADIYKNLRLIHFLQRHCLRAFTCITELAERSFFDTSSLYTTETTLKKRNHFTIYNALPCTYNSDESNKETLLNRVQNNAQNDKSQMQTSSLDLQRCNQYSTTLNSTPTTLGVVSRLEKIKGMDLVIPAFAEVLKKHPQTKLLIVGDGSLRTTMEQQATAFGCADSITWAGRKQQEELPYWYRQMDIVLMPSRSEGFGLTAIEAMAQGCVVVASETGGLPEVVRHDICGLLHHAEDIKDMAEKINTLIDDKELYSRLRTQALCEVEKYSFERYAKLINDLYNKCLNSKQ